MKRILVLGGNGYLGRHLIHRLSKDTDNTVFAVDKNTVDLRDLNQCTRLFNHSECDEIYQLAADSGNIKYLMSKEYMYGDSTLININVIAALRKIGYKGKILFPSSFYVYDGTNRYGIEKLYNEHMYNASGLDARIARLFSVYGPGESLNSSGEKVTTALCRKFIESDGGVKISGSPLQVRYFLYVSDAIDGLISQMKCRPPSKLEFAGDEEITFGKMVRTIEKIDDRRHQIWFSMDNQNENIIVPATKDTKAILKWKPTITFEEGMGKLYEWVKNELH